MYIIYISYILFVLYAADEKAAKIRGFNSMTEITSRSNDKIKYAVRLGESACARRNSCEFFLEGARLCSDAAETGIEIKTAFFTASALKKYASYAQKITAAAKECFLVSTDVAKKLSGTDSAQGIFCICACPEADNAKDVLDTSGKYIALENVQDPSNLGAVCRTAEALGLSGVIVSGGCDIYNPKALRAAMGSSLRIKLMSASDLPALLRFANEKSMLTLASTPRADAVSISTLDLNVPVICCVGNEGNGLTEETINTCRTAVTIPMQGLAESLNASAAAAILAWELVRGS